MTVGYWWVNYEHRQLARALAKVRVGAKAEAKANAKMQRLVARKIVNGRLGSGQINLFHLQAAISV